MMRTRITITLVAAYLAACIVALHAQQRTDDGPRFTNGNMLIRPADYREWVFLSSGLGMTYAAPGTSANAAQMFGNVYVNPSSYRRFMQTGQWPDRTLFILEQRASATEGSIVKGGRFQSGLAGMEAEVKDARLPGGWAFFLFGGPPQMRDAVAPLAGQAGAGCVECHTNHTAVERTFVQFYPTLLEVARAKGTVKPGF